MITLYIKTHNITGIKYFGKTIKNPFKYKGSGTYWKWHLKKHGNDVSTKIYAQMDDNKLELIEDIALDFSKENNIVKSSSWANLILENGGIGYYNNIDRNTKISNALTGRAITKEHIEKIKISRKGYRPTEETKKKIGLAGIGRVVSQRTRDKISEGHMGKTYSEETKHKMSLAKINCERGNNSKKINIYDINGLLMFECYGNFDEVCKNNNLPYKVFKYSYQNEGSIIYNKRKPRIDYNTRFIGWYAKII